MKLSRGEERKNTETPINFELKTVLYKYVSKLSSSHLGKNTNFMQMRYIKATITREESIFIYPRLILGSEI